MTIKDAFRLTRMEWLWVVIIIMLGINMYWTAILINPILQIAENQRNLAKIAITQNEQILDLLRSEEGQTNG